METNINIEVYDEVMRMAGKDHARLRQIRGVLAGLGLWGKMSTPQSAAWLIYTLAAAPTSERKKLVVWVERQYHFFQALELKGEMSAVKALEDLFNDPAKCKEVTAIMIEKITGAVMLHAKKTGIHLLTNYTNEPVPEMPHCLFIPGDVLQRFADYFAWRRAALN
jgi:hypothetical protein